MTPTTTASKTLTNLDLNALKFLAGCTGPCITVVLPAHHPGAQSGNRRAQIQSLVRTAREEVTRLKPGVDTVKLLAPLEEIAHEGGLEGGGSAVAIFRVPGYVAQYALPGQPAERVTVGDHFRLLPFVKSASMPHDFFIVGLSKKHLRLFRLVNGKCQELLLPTGVPGSLDAASALDKPEHNLEGRSSAGSSTGAMRAVQFGVGTDRESSASRLRHFFTLVDRGLAATLGEKPLVLLGVREEVAEYRRVAHHAHILNSHLQGNVDYLSHAEIAALATQAADEEYGYVADRVLAEFREMPDRSRTLAEVPTILKAAAEGRVHRLCFRADSDSLESREADRINEAVVETIRNGGEVFAVPPEKLAGAGPLAAILRY